MITRNRAFGIVLSVVAVLVLTVSSVKAQSNSKNYGSRRARELSSSNNSSQFSSSGIQRRLRGLSVRRDRFAKPNLGPSRSLSSNPSSKPFSTISRSPTVTPYLALNNSFNQVSDYYNIVRPQQEQRRVNQQMQRQHETSRRRLNQLAAQGPYSRTGNENAAPTGHAAVFQSLGTYLNTGGYYAGPPTSQAR